MMYTRPSGGLRHGADGEGALQSSFFYFACTCRFGRFLVFGTVDYPFDSLLEAGVR